MTHNQSFLLSTNYGEFDVHSEENKVLSIHDAITELKNSIFSSKVKESFLDDDGFVYAINISFYYGSRYIELDDPVETEEKALNIAINDTYNYLEILNLPV